MGDPKINRFFEENDNNNKSNVPPPIETELKLSEFGSLANSPKMEKSPLERLFNMVNKSKIEGMDSSQKERPNSNSSLLRNKPIVDGLSRFIKNIMTEEQKSAGMDKSINSSSSIRKMKSSRLIK